MLCFIAANNRESPHLMTRFREEHYDTKAHRAWAEVQRADHESHTDGEEKWNIAVRKERRTLRSEYLKAAAKKRAPVQALQARWKLDDF